MVQHHVSAAVKHLRGWITIVAFVVAICAVSQMLVYGFANYTDVRFKEVQKATPNGERRLEVLPPSETAAASETAAEKSDTPVATGGVRSHAIEHGREVAPTRVKSNLDSVLGTVSETAAAVGVLGCASLCLLTLLGVVIAGGGNVPGVEKAVTAGFWSIVLGLLCVPWSSAFPGLKVPGVFTSYAALTAAADGSPGAVGETAAIFQWLVMPFMTAVLSLFVCGWFRTGVERGIIATSVNQFDAAIEKEMTTIAKRGVAAGGNGAPRTLGVLNRAVGAAPVSPMAAPMKPIPASKHTPETDGHLSVEQAVDEAAAMAAALAREAEDATSPSAGRGVADAGFRRLI